jgi:hypothetical protein
MSQLGLLSNVARTVLAALLGLTLVGTLVVAPVGCSTSNYECGDRINYCGFDYDEVTCELEKGCVWRSGCQKPCPDQAAPCVTPCRNTTQGYAVDEASCVDLASEGCSWLPSCWEDPAQLCERDLSEDECGRRGCRWEKVGPKF